MTTYLGKSCSFGLLRVSFVNCRQFMYLVISLLVLRAGCGIWLCQFLIIAYHFTFLVMWLKTNSSLWSLYPKDANIMTKCVFNISKLSKSHKIFGYELPSFLGRVKKSFQQWLHRTHPSWLIISYEWPTQSKRATKEYGRLLSKWDSVRGLSKYSKVA